MKKIRRLIIILIIIIVMGGGFFGYNSLKHRQKEKAVEKQGRLVVLRIEKIAILCLILKIMSDKSSLWTGNG